MSRPQWRTGWHRTDPHRRSSSGGWRRRNGRAMKSTSTGKGAFSMLDVSRRELIVSVSAAAALAGVPAMVVAQAASAAAAWDLSDLYPSDAAWETERQALLKAIPRLAAQKGTLGRSAASMREALVAQSDINKRTSRLYTYASLKADEDRRVAPNQERKQQAQDVFTALGEATAWTNPESRRARREEGECVHRRGSGASEAVRVRASRHAAARAAHPVAEGGAAARLRERRSRDRRTSATSSPRRISRGRRSSSATARKSGSTTRAIRSPAQCRTAPTARWSSTNSGRATRRSRIRSARRWRRRSRGSSSTPRRAITTARSGVARWRQQPEAVYRSLIAETNRGLPVLHRYFALRQRMLGLPDMGYWDIYPPLVKSDRSYSLAEMRAADDRRGEADGRRLCEASSAT